MAVVNAHVGAPGPAGAEFAVKVDAGGPVRVAVADNEAMSGPVFTASQAVDAEGAAKVTIAGLEASTRYWWRVEDNGAIDTTVTGRFRTHPPIGAPASFSFAVGGDAGLNTSHPGPSGLYPDRVSDWAEVFDEVDSLDPLFFVHVGDEAYYWQQPPVVNPDPTLATYRDMHDAILATRQGVLYRTVPRILVWDDHGWAGPKASANRTWSGRDAAAQVYRERVAHYPLVEDGSPGNGAIYHSFQVARTLFVATDLMYHMDPWTDSPRSVLGTAQKTWLDGLLAAPPAGAELLVWINSRPINGPATDPADGMTWRNFDTERQELYTMFGDHGWIGKMMSVSGDQHWLAFDSGANTAGFPQYTMAALDADVHEGAGTYYDVGVHSARGQFGTIDITDLGTAIAVRARGRVVTT